MEKEGKASFSQREDKLNFRVELIQRIFSDLLSEKKYYTMKLFLFFAMKIYLLLTGSTVLLGTIGFFGIQYYETSHNCTVSAQSEYPFFVCISNNYNFSNNDCMNNGGFGCITIDKPLILLYPEKTINVDINLGFSGGYIATFPRYDNEKHGWSVTVTPESIVTDSRTGMETYGLFWEGNLINGSQFDLSKGFVIEGINTQDFLYEKLRFLGLTTKEYSDFIMYWYPKLQDYPYVQITFAGKDYTDIAPLIITPKPDSFLRVFMIAMPLNGPKVIQEQKLEKFERKGFTVVEWGGTMIQ